MGQFWDEIPDFVFPWLEQQKLFFVATAPLSEDGHVNVSPKGYRGTFRAVDKNRVWYEDLSGSGCETIAHVRENGRITIMFVAFEGPPRIVRFFGKATIHEFGTPEYDTFLPPGTRQPSSRSVVVVDVHKCSTSCGFSIPLFTYKAERLKHRNIVIKFEQNDISAEEEKLASCSPGTPLPSPPPRSDKGLRAFWTKHNLKSIDGLPSLQIAYDANKRFDRDALKEWTEAKADNEEISTGTRKSGALITGTSHLSQWVDGKAILGLAIGVGLAKAGWVDQVWELGREVTLRLLSSTTER